MDRILLIFLGGGVGSVLRYLVQGWFHRPTFPLGTLLVNVAGCLLIGFLGGLFFGARPIAENYRFAILTGLLGGFTTFSSFGWETMQLTEDKQYLYAGLNVVLSVTLGLLAVWLGRQSVTLLYGVQT